MLTVSASNKLDNGRVLVTTIKSTAPSNPIEYYSVKEENVDKFIKERKSIAMNDSLQKSLSTACSVIGGVLIGSNLKSNNLFKFVAGAASALGLYKATTDYLDKPLHDMMTKNLLKNNDAQDITKDMVEKYQQH